MNWQPQMFEEPQEPEKKPQYTQIVLQKKTKSYYLTLIQKIISIIVNIFMIILFGLLIYQMKDTKNLLQNDSKSWGKEKEVCENTLKLEDWKGYSSIFDDICELAQNIKKPESNIDHIPRGILLCGPPGTGKTYLAKCLAGEIKDNAVFFVVNGSDFVEKFVGLGASRVRQLFAIAKETALQKNKKYFFIFIDEIDSIGKKRSFESNGNSNERDDTLNALLSEIDGFNSNNEKNPYPPYGIVLGSTNREDILDKALLREGRLGKKIFLDSPKEIDIQDMLKYFLKKRGSRVTDVNVNAIVEDKTLLQFFAQSRLTASDINSLIKKAFELASKQKKHLTTDELYESFNEVKLGPKNKQDETDENVKADQNRIAVHELGHAVVSHALGFDVSYINIESRGSIGGYTLSSSPQNNKLLFTFNDVVKKIIVLLGGRAAEQVILNDVSQGSCDDLEKAIQNTKQIVKDFKMSLKTPNDIIMIEENDENQRIRLIINNSYKIAQEIIQEYKNNKLTIWEKLVNELKKHKKINKEFFVNNNDLYKMSNNTINNRILNILN
ncbi:AAA family ATPase [Candidatus Phytoplasma fraxini]|uniref:Cell division-associated, ATP-dependent zinc metalloprotease FtsH n=1 Tax=Ash yellows phytoplasma TaxID=35780 RepID=A0ABZ2U8Q1_ASHYP